ncbi:AI-2E family transporter [Candidatus Falkowbacteria bacterium]|nr:AI-2E family transporter [Candidatus Falkowbacteria bacterium]
MEKGVVHISILSIVKFFLVILLFYFLYLIKSIIGILFVALILSSAVDPWVDKLQNKKIPRSVSVLLFYILLLAAVFLVIFFGIPPVVNELGMFGESFPVYYEKIADVFSNIKSFSAQHGLLEDFNASIENIKNTIVGGMSDIFSSAKGFLASVISFFIVLVITFYMAVEENAIKRTLRYLVPDKYQPFVVQLINKIQKKIGDWLKGQLILCLIVGIMVYVGLLIFGVKFALLLAILAMFGELIPYAGPIIAAIPAVLLTFAQSPAKTIFVILFYIVVQRIENDILVPKIMQKAVGLNPIVSIIALLIGAQIGGLIGVILSIPVATAVMVIVQELWSERETLSEIRGEEDG